ncbi:hypothetical protein LTSEMIS_4201 [Salmonella enterica subsp. enterica serovar Mississippi str. A4-633]|nr:hypothetical protein LTSEMIS_4201 [Salmonella enterica subsp. enterica serovar Mississippi str. A4-633]
MTELTLLPFPPLSFVGQRRDAMVYRRRYDRWAEFTLYR